jgi:surfactin synthase thioesterase subunit
MARCPVNLYLFPFAGGASHAFRPLAGHLPEGIVARPHDYPGHGRRLRESLLTDLEALADDAFARIRDELRRPYALFGHSMGALVAWLVATRAAAAGFAPPRLLVTSGHRAPWAPNRRADFHGLPREAFFESILGLGGTPPEIAGHPELLDYIEPILRADFTAVETWKPPAPQPLEAPILVLRGTGDSHSRADAERWAEASDRPMTLREFPGGHFFLLDHWVEAGRLVGAALAGRE